MRKIGAVAVIAVLAAVMCAPSPGEAFGLRLGPLHLGLPIPRLAFGHRHPMRLHATAPAPLYDSVNAPVRPGVESQQSPTSVFLYPGLALPAISEDIFESSSAWPLDYDTILTTAFAKVDPGQASRACQPAAGASAAVGRIKEEIRPNATQAKLMQKLGTALGQAAGYLAMSCPKEVPPQPVARLTLMEWQIQKLGMALDIIRPTLQQFEQSLSKSQQARFDAVRSPPRINTAGSPASNIDQNCEAGPTAVDSSVEQINQSVQLSDEQRGALANLKLAFASAVTDLDSHCPTTVPPTPLARLEAAETRVDATWRAVVAIQVALANFESKLSDEQRGRLDGMDFVAAR